MAREDTVTRQSWANLRAALATSSHGERIYVRINRSRLLPAFSGECFPRTTCTRCYRWKTQASKRAGLMSVMAIFRQLVLLSLPPLFQYHDRRHSIILEGFVTWTGLGIVRHR